MIRRSNYREVDTKVYNPENYYNQGFPYQTYVFVYVKETSHRGVSLTHTKHVNIYSI